MMAKSRKYVVLLAKSLHDWRESLWLKVFVIGINAVCPCLYSGIHVTTKEVHGIESLYTNSIRCQLLCPQGRLGDCSCKCPTASLAFGRIVGNLRPLVVSSLRGSLDQLTLKVKHGSELKLWVCSDVISQKWNLVKWPVINM